MKTFHKKILKWTGIVLLTPIALVVLVAVLLYLPPVQNWAVKKVAAYASEQTGMDITVDHVRLVFPLDLGVEGFRMTERRDSMPQVRDTVADVGSLVADVQLLPLFRSQVEIDELEFNRMKLNTTHFVHEARVKGTIGRLSVKSHGIDLRQQLLRVNEAQLSDARLCVELSDTVPPDTTKKKTFWKISVDDIDIARTDVTVHTPGDTLQVEAYMGTMKARGGYFDLYSGLYQLARMDWMDGRLKYDSNFEPRLKGLDYHHLLMTDVNIGLDSLYYLKPRLNLRLRACAFREKSGIRVNEFTGPVSLDSTRVALPLLHFRTPDSELRARFNMDLNTFDAHHPGLLYAWIDGSFGKQDLMRFMGAMPPSFVRQWPNHPLSVIGLLKGNMQHVDFSGLRIALPTAFRIHADGQASALTDMKHLSADVRLSATTWRIGFITSMLPPSLMRKIRIPSGLSVDGRFRVRSKDYDADFTAREGGGSVRAKAHIDTRAMAYNATLSARRLALNHFLPGYGLNPFTGYVHATGRGFDVMSPRTALTAKARIQTFRYSRWNLSGMTANARIRRGVVHADVDSRNPLLDGKISLDALMSTKKVLATLACDLKRADLYNLRVMDEPLVTALCAHVDVASDLKENYKVQGLVSDMTVLSAHKAYRPEDVVLDVFTRRDSTHAIVDCGDFHLNMDGTGGYKRLMSEGSHFLGEVMAQLKERKIDQVRLRRRLPDMHLYLSSGKDNFIYTYLSHKGYEFKNLLVDVRSSHVNGLNGDISIDSLVTDSMRLDTIKLCLVSDSTELGYVGKIRNAKDNPQYVFNALFAGKLSDSGSNLMVRLYDANNRLGLSAGIAASMEEKGLRFHLMQKENIIGYKTFTANDDNYVFLGDDRRVSAKLQLMADDGTGVQVYTNDENTDALQDLTVSLHKFDLEKLMTLLPYTPDVSGIMNGDFHVIQTKDELSVSSNLSVNNMIYEHCPLGNVGSEFVYMPKSDGSHYVDGILTSEGKEVATLEGTYLSKGDGYLDAKLSMNRLPLSMANGFIPEQLIGFKGYAEGELAVKGSLQKPQVNGEAYLDSCYLISVPYGVEMRFDNDPVRIVGSHLLFENFEMYAHNDSPLNVSGYFDFSDLNRMYLDLKMRAMNFNIINSKENPRSETYGKAYVNFFAMMKGPLENLRMRGKLDVLGSTDMTYVLRDSPLTTDNRLDDLVKFTNFNDTTQQAVNRPPLTGLDMDLSMSVDEGAHIKCDLNSDHTNYVDLIGGGDLRMQYNAIDNLRLTGRYTLNNGEMKYSLPIIPLKTFTIQDGSYIEFTGDPMDPHLNITATERTKATVSEEGSSGRSVAFDCGVIITKSLKNMGLEFTIDAPEDMSLHNELATMTKEERGKLAVTMLTTGMYLADGNTSGFSMNSALSSFLQGEINNITGNALKTLDLSFGMDNTTDASGSMHTDYSFKFAKRFWNNRLRIVIGGKVSTGSSDDPNQNKSFFDDVTFEYRLSQTSNKYLKLFYNRSAYDWLEGEIGQYGVGFMWRRKLQHFKDIINFKGDEQTVPPPADSVKTK